MQTISDSEAREHLGTLLDQISREPVTITKNGAAAAVLLGANEYAAIEETLHLLSTPTNAERLRQGLSDYTKGQLQTGELCD